MSTIKALKDIRSVSWRISLIKRQLVGLKLRKVVMIREKLKQVIKISWYNEEHEHDCCASQAIGHVGVTVCSRMTKKTLTPRR